MGGYVAAAAAFKVGGALLGRDAKAAQTRANNRISALNAKVGNETRQASNAARAAQGNLARFVQSVNNNRALEAGGNAQEGLLVNYLRSRDAGMVGNFSDDIRSAEQAGHAAASAAMAGVDGNVVDMVNGSTALRDSIVRQSVDEKQNAVAYDVSRRAGTIFSQMVSSMDNSVILDTLDYNVDYGQQGNVPSAFATAFNALLDFAPQAVQALGATQGQPAAKPSAGGVNYNLADYAYSNKVDFRFKDPSVSSEKPSPYELWQGDTKLGDTPQQGGSMYSLWSR